MIRRDFVKKAGGLAAIGTIISACDACNSKEPVVTPVVPVSFSINLDDSQNASLQNIGGAVIHNNIIIIRRSETVYVALSMLCTHANCIVNYSSNTNRLVCPCHGSIFSNTGAVIQGPATAALPTYSISITGSTLTIQSN